MPIGVHNAIYRIKPAYLAGYVENILKNYPLAYIKVLQIPLVEYFTIEYNYDKELYMQYLDYRVKHE